MDKSNAATPDRGVEELLSEYSEHTQRLLRVPDDEEGACAIVLSLLTAGRMHDVLDVPEVATWEREMPFPRGRADFALFHVDGSVSIIEVKRQAALRTMLAGIGQLALYGMQAGYGLRGVPIRRVLAVSIAGNHLDASTLEEACDAAGVVFVPLGSVIEHQDNLHALLLRHAEVCHVPQ